MSFPITARNRAKRSHERATYDKDAIFAILDSAMMCHVSYVIDGQPYCTPTLHWREGEVLYWHGSSASRMLRHLGRGAPACLTVSHLDGLVMARSAFNHSVNYRSAMCFGTAYLIEDADEKLAALRAMVDRFFPSRYDTLRPVSPQEIKATAFVSMQIEDAAAKTRSHGVGVDPADEGFPVWAGVIPVETRLGADIPCPRTDPPLPRPEGLAAYGAGAALDQALADMQRLYAG